MCRRAKKKKFRSFPAEYSHLYLCIAGELAAVICISDPLTQGGGRRQCSALHDVRH